MKKCAGLGIVVAMAVVLLTGCSWETGGDATSWSSAFNWVSFNGLYRAASGGVLVSAYSSTPATPESTETVTVDLEAQGFFSAGATAFAGKLRHEDVVPGSVVIAFMDGQGQIFRSLSDNGEGTLGADLGTIQYVSGAWEANFGLNPVTAPGVIQASYSYTRTVEAEVAGNTLPGSTGKSIYSISIVHQGQNLTLTDNNGATFSGTIGEMRSSSGYENTDITQVGADEQANDSLHAKYTYQESPLPPPNDAITATFSCAGVSTAGYQVKIVGSLSGVVDATGLVFTGRKIDATWVEVGGKAGNINGYAANTAITPSTTTTTTSTNATDTTTTGDTTTGGTTTGGTTTGGTTIPTDTIIQ